MAACGNEELGGSCIPASCCDKVTFTTADEAFLALYGGYFALLTFLIHPTTTTTPTTPTINYRSDYIWAENNNCLWYTFGLWKMEDCSHIGSSTYNIKTESTTMVQRRLMLQQWKLLVTTTQAHLPPSHRAVTQSPSPAQTKPSLDSTVHSSAQPCS